MPAESPLAALLEAYRQFDENDARQLDEDERTGRIDSAEVYWRETERITAYLAADTDPPRGLADGDVDEELREVLSAPTASQTAKAARRLRESLFHEPLGDDPAHDPEVRRRLDLFWEMVGLIHDQGRPERKPRRGRPPSGRSARARRLARRLHLEDPTRTQGRIVQLLQRDHELGLSGGRLKNVVSEALKGFPPERDPPLAKAVSALKKSRERAGVVPKSPR